MEAKRTGYNAALFRVLTQRTDFTLAAAPLAAGVRQSNHYISSFPVCTPQRLQYVLWDCRASWAAVSICQRCHIPCTISPYLGLGWILLMAKLREGICGPWVEGLFSKKSFYNSRVKLMSSSVVCCCKNEIASSITDNSYLGWPCPGASETLHMWRWQLVWTLVRTVSPHKKRDGPQCTALGQLVQSAGPWSRVLPSTWWNEGAVRCSEDWNSAVILSDLLFMLDQIYFIYAGLFISEETQFTSALHHSKR